MLLHEDFEGALVDRCLEVFVVLCRALADGFCSCWIRVHHASQLARTDVVLHKPRTHTERKKEREAEVEKSVVRSLRVLHARHATVRAASQCVEYVDRRGTRCSIKDLAHERHKQEGTKGVEDTKSCTVHAFLCHTTDTTIRRTDI